MGLKVKTKLSTLDQKYLPTCLASITSKLFDMGLYEFVSGRLQNSAVDYNYLTYLEVLFRRIMLLVGEGEFKVYVLCLIIR